MAIRKAKSITPGLRGASFDNFSDITSTTPERRLLIIRKQQSGRNNQGKITVRHRGGGHKRYIRIVDFKRDKFDVPGKVMTIEYDPNRNARLALVCYADGEKRYIVAPVDLKVGDEIMSSQKLIEIKTGNALPLEYIPAGMPVYNVELRPGFGGKLARSAGNAVYVMGVDKKNAQLRMPSGEIRLVNKACLCTVGQVSNPDIARINLGKAGRTRHLGIRPTVRGTAMNPKDHPHGGGEGNQPIGLKYPKTPWGKHALGVRTRNPKAASNSLIIQRRKKKR
ncbi:MAG TPA: 50S ribosomal protein L2 [bacterium]|nr:50S ribosomal protein L2 [bacterium]